MPDSTSWLDIHTNDQCRGETRDKQRATKSSSRESESYNDEQFAHNSRVYKSPLRITLESISRLLANINQDTHHSADASLNELYSNIAVILKNLRNQMREKYGSVLTFDGLS